MICIKQGTLIFPREQIHELIFSLLHLGQPLQRRRPHAEATKKLDAKMKCNKLAISQRAFAPKKLNKPEAPEGSSQFTSSSVTASFGVLAVLPSTSAATPSEFLRLVGAGSFELPAELTAGGSPRRRPAVTRGRVLCAVCASSPVHVYLEAVMH